MSLNLGARFREAASVVNAVEISKFPLLLTKLIQKLHQRSSQIFNQAEEEQLKLLFGFSDDQLRVVLDSSSYVFEQAAFNAVGPEPMYDALVAAEVDEAHAKVFGRIWATEAPGLIVRLKSRSLGAPTLLESQYRLHIDTQEDGKAKGHEASAVLELKVGKPDSSLDKVSNFFD